MGSPRRLVRRHDLFHRLDRHDAVAVQRPKPLSDGRHHGVVLRSGAHDERVDPIRRLRERRVDVERRGGDLTIPRVGDDADDGPPHWSRRPRAIERRHLQPFADGRLARPGARRESLAHDHDWRSRRPIAFGEKPSLKQSRAHGRKVVGRRRLQVDKRIAARGLR